MVCYEYCSDNVATNVEIATSNLQSLYNVDTATSNSQHCTNVALASDSKFTFQHVSSEQWTVLGDDLDQTHQTPKMQILTPIILLFFTKNVKMKINNPKTFI